MGRRNINALSWPLNTKKGKYFTVHCFDYPHGTIQSTLKESASILEESVRNYIESKAQRGMNTVEQTREVIYGLLENYEEKHGIPEMEKFSFKNHNVNVFKLEELVF